ncbi:ABC transporter substrate-binding protein [Patulibacter sp. NPDC049589]|uniref:ABC transporter substrate-binding protein n=1 Tax=Patulibacter sp. NPDC049589 TaxID=3154731 RepID=UPI003447C706
MSHPSDRLSRRTLLRRGALGAGAVFAGGSILAACGGDETAGPKSSTAPASTTAGPAGDFDAELKALGRKVRLNWGGGACEAPLYAAYHQGFFEEAGVPAELTKISGAAGRDAVSTGKADFAPGILFEWLKPIEQGLDIRLTGGLHKGCLRTVAHEKSGITSLAQLKGKEVGTDSIGGSAMAFFSIDIAKAGINPAKDIKWRVFQGDALDTALRKREVDVIVSSDPFGYLSIDAGYGREIGSNASPEHRDQYCCATTTNYGFLQKYPAVTAKVVQAWFRGSLWAGKNIEATAKLENEKKYVAADRETLEKLLSSYIWEPGVDQFHEQLTQGAKDFKATGYLTADTDTTALAKKAFVDVLGQTNTPVPTAA